MRIVSIRVWIVLLAVSLFGWVLSSGEILAKGPGGGGGPQNGTIVGEAVGASGGIAGATVLLFDGVSIDQVDETFTDANGNFRFDKVPAGEYSVTVVSLNPPCSGSTTVNVAPKKIVVVVVACQ